jgi:hypothetical protein
VDIPICGGAGDQRQASVAWDPSGSQFVVVWSDTRVADDENVYAARIALDGTVLDPCGVAISSAPGQQFAPSIAASGAQMLVLWDDRRSDAYGDVVGTRLDTSAGIAALDPDGVTYASGASAQTGTTVVGLSGGRFAIAWVDDRNEPVSRNDIHGATLLPTGAMDGTEYVIAGSADNEGAPSFEAGVNATSRAFIAYERTRLDLGTTRAVRRRIDY